MLGRIGWVFLLGVFYCIYRIGLVVCFCRIGIFVSLDAPGFLWIKCFKLDITKLGIVIVESKNFNIF